MQDGVQGEEAASEEVLPGHQLWEGSAGALRSRRLRIQAGKIETKNLPPPSF